jgi:hypothetical protein
VIRTFDCPACRCKLRVDERSVRRKSRCPACRARIRPPDAILSWSSSPAPAARQTRASAGPALAASPTMRKVCCPACRQVLRLNLALGLRAGQCPACRTPFRIPPNLTRAAPPSPLPLPPARRPVPAERSGSVRRLACPGCRRPLRLNPALGLRAGQCPACRTPFRIPEALPGRPTPRPLAPRQPWEPGLSEPFDLNMLLPGQARTPAAGSPPGGDAAASGSVYGLGDGPAGQAPATGPVPDFLPDELAADFPPELGRPRKRRKRQADKPPMSLEVGNLLITAGVLGFVWLLLVILVIRHPDVAFIMMLFGAGSYVVGRCWFLFIAWEEGLEDFLKCFVIPFYDWFFLYMNFDRYGRAFGVRIFGVLTFLVAGIVYHLTDGGNVEYAPQTAPRQSRPAPAQVAPAPSQPQTVRPEAPPAEKQRPTPEPAEPREPDGAGEKRDPPGG